VCLAQNLSLANKVSYGGLLPDHIVKEAVAMLSDDPTDPSKSKNKGGKKKRGEKEATQSTHDHASREHMYLRWFHKRHACYKCLATGTVRCYRAVCTQMQYGQIVDNIQHPESLYSSAFIVLWSWRCMIDRGVCMHAV
jgi:hypothetical protein